MSKVPNLISPIDSQYTGHREAEQRRQQTREWLEKRERDIGFVSDAPSLALEKDQQG
jgi:hypothetical protein